MAKIFSKSVSEAPKSVEVTIATPTIFKTILLVFGTILAFLAVKKSLHVLSLIGVAFFLSLALDAPVRWLAARLPGKKQNKRTLATAISMGLVIALLLGFLIAIVPPLVKQTVTFVRDVPALVESTKNGDGPIGEFVVKYKLQDDVAKLSDQLSNRIGNIGGATITTASRVGTSVFSLLTVIVLTIMMLTEGPAWRKVLLDVIPAKRRSRLQRLGRDMNKVVQGYVNGQVLLAAIAALLITPIFFIMGVSYPIALTVIVFICGLIPMVGHTIGAVICTIVALFTSFPAALVLLGYYIFFFFIENYAVQPKVQANSTNMSPLLVFVAVLLGGSFGGLLGALVAIPVMGCLRIALLDYLETRGMLSKATTRDAKTQGGAI